MANDVIEKFDELKKLVGEREFVERCIVGAKNIGLDVNPASNIHNKIEVRGGTYGGKIPSLDNVRQAVGGKFNDLVAEFAQRVEFELLKKKEALDLEIERYEVVKRE